MLERNPYICNSEKDIEAYKIFKEAENLAEIGIYVLCIYFIFFNYNNFFYSLQ